MSNQSHSPVHRGWPGLIEAYRDRMPVGDDWKIVTRSQKDGPAPVPGDERASSAEEMAQAVQEYGGLTYAR